MGNNLHRKMRLQYLFLLLNLLSISGQSLVSSGSSSSSSGSSSGCPPPEDIMPCRCRDKNEQIQVWCSHSDLNGLLGGLETLMTLRALPSIDELIVENNRLPSLPARAFAALRIGRLLLRNNGLESVSRNAFAGLENSLEELYVVEEKLHDFPFDCIENLHNLEAFTVEKSKIRLLPRFNGLNRLKHIRIDGSEISGFPVGAFASMASVKQIHIVGGHVSGLANGIFGPLQTLVLANFSGNRIQHIQRRSFALLPKLEVLSLDENLLEDAIGVGRACEDLTSLKSLELAGNRISALPEGSFVSLGALQMLNLARNLIEEGGPRALSHMPALRKVDLSWNRLASLPKNFLDSTPLLEELRLRGNRLGGSTELGGILGSLGSLRHLDLGQNGIESIHTGAFQDHLQLQRIDLSDNEISRIHRNAFKNVPSLTEMSLRNNSLTDLPLEDEWSLHTLRELDLSQNNLQGLQRSSLLSIAGLQRLDLSSNSIKSIVPGGTLTPLRNLEYLDLSSNGLQQVAHDSLKGLDKLTKLELSKNHLSALPPGLFRDTGALLNLNLANNRLRSVEQGLLQGLRSLEEMSLKSNSLRALPAGFFQGLESLRVLNLKNNAISEFPRGIFSPLSRSLEILKLASNQITRVDGALEGLESLKILDLTGNRLTKMGGDSLKGLTSLEKFEARENRISSVEEGTLSDSIGLQVLDLAHNALATVPSLVTASSVLKVLDLSHNLIKSLEPEVLQGNVELVEVYLNDNQIKDFKPRTFYNLPMLTIVDLDGNDLEVIDPETFSSLPKLIYLRLSKNKIRRVRESAFKELSSLDGLDLQENELEGISIDSFDRTNSLKYLNLSHNNFDRTESMGLDKLTSLEVLDISSNRVQDLEENSLKHLQWLVELRLNDNGICRLPLGVFDGMSRLKMLVLKNNFISHLFETVFYRLKNNIAFIDISGNPISCDCDLIWLRNMISRESIQEITESTCEFPHDLKGSVVKVVRPARMVCSNSIVTRQGHPSKFEDPLCPKLLVSKKRARPSRLDKIVQEKPHFGNPLESDYFSDITELNNELKNNQRKDDKKLIESSDYISGDTPTIYAGSNQKNHHDKLEVPKKSVGNGFGGLGSIFGIPLPSLDFGLNLGISPSIGVAGNHKNLLSTSSSSSSGDSNRGFSSIRNSHPLPPNWIQRPAKAEIQQQIKKPVVEEVYEHPEYIPRKPNQPYIPLNPYAASETSPILSSGTKNYPLETHTLSKIKFPASTNKVGQLDDSWAPTETETGFIPIEPFFHGQPGQRRVRPQPNHQKNQNNQNHHNMMVETSTTMAPFGEYSIHFGPTTTTSSLEPLQFQFESTERSSGPYHTMTMATPPSSLDYELTFDPPTTTTTRPVHQDQDDSPSLSDFWSLFSGGGSSGSGKKDEEDKIEEDLEKNDLSETEKYPFNFSAPVDETTTISVTPRPDLDDLRIETAPTEGYFGGRRVPGGGGGGRPTITKLESMDDLEMSDRRPLPALQDSRADPQESSTSNARARVPPVLIGGKAAPIDWYYRDYGVGNGGEELERYLQRARSNQIEAESELASSASKNKNYKMAALTLLFSALYL